MSIEDLRNEEWQQLDQPTREAALAVIEQARRTGTRTGEPWKGGEIYAYPHPGGGMAWGVDSRVANLYRGVMPAAVCGMHQGDYIRSLQRVGSDEAAFHQVFTGLRDDTKLSNQALTIIARAFCDRVEEWPDRIAALGAIETAFYDQRNLSPQRCRHR